MAQFDRALDTVMDASMTRMDGFEPETPSHRPPPPAYGSPSSSSPSHAAVHSHAHSQPAAHSYGVPARDDSDSLLSLIARERDELASHADMLRREVDEMRARAARSTAPRELAELREQLGQREREIKRLKDSNVARERLLVEARERADRLSHERGIIEQRLALRERNALEWEGRISALSADLDAERRRTASAAEAFASERDEARRLLEQAQTQLAFDRNRAVREQAALREQVNSLEASRREFELSQTARFAELTGEVAVAREALVRRERELREESEARLVKALDERTHDLGARHQVDLARAAGAASGREFALHETYSEKLRALAIEHAREFDDMFAANGALGLEVERARVQGLADAEAALARLEGRLAGERFAHAERMDDQLRKHSVESLEMQREAQSRMNTLLDELEIANGQLAQQLESATSRHAAELAASSARHAAELAASSARHVGELEAVRVGATAQRATRESLESRVQELEKRVRESSLQRDQLAERLAQAMARLGTARKSAGNETTQIAQEAKKLATLVGELTFAVVEQTALRSAAEHQRAKPTAFDVDDALSRVAERVPDDVAEQLWSSRDRLLESLGAKIDAADA